MCANAQRHGRLLNIGGALCSDAHYYTSSGRQPNFAALNRGRHLYSAGGHHVWHWPTFLVLSVFLLFFPRLISAVGDWIGLDTKKSPTICGPMPNVMAALPSVQYRKVWLTPTIECRAVPLPRRETR